MLKLYLLIAMITILGSAGYGGFVYVTDLQERVATLRSNNEKLEGALATQKETMDRIVANAQRQADLNRELGQKLQQAEAGLDRLRTRFTQIDITKEALEDPAGLETRINNAVNRLITDIEKQTSPAVADPDPAAAE